MRWINRIGLGLILYLILMVLLEMREDISLTAYVLIGFLGFIGAILIVMPHDKKETA